MQRDARKAGGEGWVSAWSGVGELDRKEAAARNGVAAAMGGGGSGFKEDVCATTDLFLNSPL